ncbi:MAG: bifunctional 5,10-methylene-tetrahydrofolate dehydrogenase/5,10-methylene-tetrahydrofolate cyclohydrolase, partial [candidate division WOR-3 bacterium]|nr:bifunctional 5,10-methylene-tetrahydrofolate dehydrogenase/5,10-methylene-tetrahydrofolate cyclohydrolase [candidate division WOR-3 bacterium]
MKILDGKALSAKIKEELKTEVAKLINNGVVPNLGVILVGDFPPSVIYVRNKETACAEVGIKTQTLRLKNDITEAHLLEIIDNWNQDKNIHGILVQMPLPEHITHQKVLDAIRADKDVDGLSSSNLGRLISNLSDANEPMFYPCTPSGIIELLIHNQITIEGKHCVIIGRGELVGKPLANMLLAKHLTLSLNQEKYPVNATVTICHSKTPNIAN